MVAIMDNIYELRLIESDENKKKIQKGLEACINYRALLVDIAIDKEIGSINSNEKGAKLDLLHEEVSGFIKDINDLLIKNNMVKVYNDDISNKEEVSEFVLKINSEIFEGRTVRRK